MHIASSHSPRFGSFYQNNVKLLKQEVSTRQESGGQFGQRLVDAANTTLSLYKDEPLILKDCPAEYSLHQVFYPSSGPAQKLLKGTLGGLTVEVNEKLLAHQYPTRTVAIYPTTNGAQSVVVSALLYSNFGDSGKFSAPSIQLAPLVRLESNTNLSHGSVPPYLEAKGVYETVAAILGKVENAIDDTKDPVYVKFLGSRLE